MTEIVVTAPELHPAMTPKVVAAILHSEGLVREAYRDGKGVWTWAGGIAETSGFDVMRYKDNPQPLDVCLRATVDSMAAHYLPGVARAFSGYRLKEHELAAALSFQWNTGAIERTGWVGMVKTGDMAGARAFLTEHYLNGGMLKARRDDEAALFFEAEWPSDLRCPVYAVAKPSYHPVHPVLTDVLPMLQSIMGGS